MLEPLTDLERGILEYLIEYLRRNTYQPSIREIGRRFDIKSTKTVSEHLQSLADKGWVERDPARSRGIRLLGLQLDVETMSVPLYDASSDEALETQLSGPDNEITPGTGLNLDRRLVGAAGVWLLPMPDESLADLGIHEGDLLLVEPVAFEDIELDDIVTTYLPGEVIVQRWPGPGSTGVEADLPGGRVIGLFRRFRDPIALVPAHATADAAIPTS
jgi:repressor LexA